MSTTDTLVDVDTPTTPPRRAGEPPSLTGLFVRLCFLAVVDALALFAVIRLFDDGQAIGAVLVIVVIGALNVVYLVPGMVPAKYLMPGTVLLLLFVAYPVGYTVFLSGTNFGTGNFISQEQAIDRILANAAVSGEESNRYQLEVLIDDAGQLAMYLVDEAGTAFLGTADGLSELGDGDVTFDGEDVATVGAFRPLTLVEASDLQEEILALEVPTDEGVVQVASFTTASERTKSIVYDAERDVMIEVETGTEFSPDGGRYVSADGRELQPGWRSGVGFDNYQRIFDNSAIRGPFLRTFVWTFAFALLSVVLALSLGLFLALALNDERVRGRRVLRSLLIIPYAIPSFMSALVWQGLLNRDFGAVNEVLGTDIAWLSDPWLARFSVLLVNTWLGFPYMMLIATGALQGIPSSLQEAARVDGATGPQVFRRITFPLLMISMSPLLIAAFAFNFNNFNVIYLLNRGGPPVAGSETPAGHTDILISYTWRLAFEGGRGQDFGFAAAISVVIFVLVATISAVSFKRTKAFEELI
ncbi:MAG: maltose ABC transporter permease MalF [Actinomycetota bacterium]